MLGYLSQIPASFWGVIVGATFPLAGVWMTNRASEKRLAAQFAHDRELKTEEREMALKKEVYLSAAEAISTGISVLANFANFEMHDEAVVKPYTEKSPVIAKVHIIGSLETIKALNAFVSELSSIFLILFSERAKISKYKIERDIVLRNIEYYSKLREGTLEMMKQSNLEHEQDQNKWNVLQSNYQYEAGYIDKAVAEHGLLNKQFCQKQLAFMKTCIDYSQQINALVPPMLRAVREELGLPLDEGGYQALIHEGIAKQQVSLERFMKELSEFL